MSGTRAVQAPVRIGVIGAGLQGEGHIRNFTSFHHAKVVAIADINTQRAAEVAAKYGVPATYGDYREMLERELIDAVSVAVPDHLHVEPALAVIAAGRHLLMEKPLALTVDDAERIVDAARDAGITLMVNFSNRFMGAVAMSRERYVSGELGNPVYAYARLNNRIYVPTQMLKSWSSRTKLPFWIMSHIIDRVRWIWDRPRVKRVYAVSNSGVLREKGFDTEDSFCAITEWDNGATANFESCWILPDTHPNMVDSKMELVFSQGTLQIDAAEQMLHIATENEYARPYTMGGTVYGNPVGFVTESLRHFVDCLIAGVEPLMTGEDGLEITKCCAAIVESAQTRQPVEIAAGVF